MQSQIEYKSSKNVPKKFKSSYLSSETDSTLQTVKKYTNNNKSYTNNLNFNNATNLNKNQQKEKNILKQQTTADFEIIDDLAVERNKNNFSHTKAFNLINSENKFKNLNIG